MKRADRPVSEVCNLFTAVPQILKNVKFKSGRPLEDNQVRSRIADAEARLGATGRLVIRPSGTEPLIRVMAEAEDEVVLREVVDGIVAAVEHAA